MDSPAKPNTEPYAQTLQAGMEVLGEKLNGDVTNSNLRRIRGS